MFGFGSSDSGAPDEKRVSDGIIGTVKSVIKSAAKWAMIAGAIGLAIAIPGAAFSGGLASVPIIGGAISTGLGWLGINVGANALAAGAISGITMGAIGGAVLGGLKGIAHFDENMEVAQEKRVMAHNNAMMRSRNEAMFAAQMSKQMGGVSPGMSPGMARGVGGRDIG